MKGKIVGALFVLGAVFAALYLYNKGKLPFVKPSTAGAGAAPSAGASS